MAAYDFISANQANGDLTNATAEGGEGFIGSVGSFSVTDGYLHGNAIGGASYVEVDGYATSSDTEQRYDIRFRKHSNVESEWWFYFGGTNTDTGYRVRIRIESNGTLTLNLWRLGTSSLLATSTGTTIGVDFDYLLRVEHTDTGINVDFHNTAGILTSNDTTHAPNGKKIFFRVDTTWAANTGLGITSVYGNVLDQINPVLHYSGANPLYVIQNDPYSNPTVTWSDNVDGSGNVTDITGDTVNTAVIDTYFVNYDFTDAQGNAADQLVLEVRVVEPVNIPKDYPGGVYPMRIDVSAPNGTTAAVTGATLTVISTVSNELGLNWDMLNAVSNSAQFDWNSFETVSNQAIVQWALLNSVSNSTQLDWGVLNSVLNSTQLDWNMLEGVSNNSELLWSMFSNVTASAQFPYNMLNSVSNSTQVDWDLLNSVVNTSEFAWSMFSAVTGSTQFNWDVLSALISVSNGVAFNWNLREAVAGSTRLDWSMLATVNQTTQLVWDMDAPLGSVSNSVAFNWDINGTVVQTLETQWSMLNSVGVTSEMRWDIAQSVQNTLQANWSLLQGASNSIQLTWDSIGLVNGELTINWTVQTDALRLPMHTMIIADENRVMTILEEDHTLTVH